MKLSEHLQNEERQHLERAWRQLTPWQRKWLRLVVAVGSLGRRSLLVLDQHIAQRRAQFVYFYPAHWLTTPPPNSALVRIWGRVGWGQGGG